MTELHPNFATVDSGALTWRQEIGKLSIIAGPLAASYLAEMGMAISDLAIVGRIGAIELAAVGLVTTILYGVLFVIMSIASVVGVFAAHSHGAGDRAQVSNAIGQGFWVATGLSIPVMVFGWYLADLLPWLGQDQAVVDAARPYAHGVTWSILPYMWFSVQRAFASALGRTQSIMAITLLALALNFLLVLLLVYGIGDWPGLGLLGAGLGTSTVCWLMFAAQSVVLARAPVFRGYGLLRASVRFDALLNLRIVKMGVPVGVMTAVEAGLFATVQIMMGIVGPVALAANQMVLNFTSFLYMIPAAIAQAAAVRVALERGAGRLAVARQGGFVAIGLNVGYMTMVMVFLLIFPQAVIHLYLDAADPANAAVIALAGQLMVFTALFQIVDGMQVAVVNALRGLEDTTVPSIIGIFGYWGLGFVSGYILCFEMGMGPVGLLLGLAMGLAVTALLLTWRYHRHTRSYIGVLRAPAAGSP